MSYPNAEVVVIIVTYNSWPTVRDCLSSLYPALESTSNSAYIELIDNSSTDNTADNIRQHFKDVHLTALKENLLYTPANNYILRQINDVKYKYVVLLNPDVQLSQLVLSELLKFMDNNPNVGIIGPKLVRPSGILDYACRRSLPTFADIWYWIFGLQRIFPRSKLFGNYNLTYLDPDLITDVDSISGAFIVIRRAVIDQIGLLDDHFAMYGSDIDYCLRARKAGWRVVYNPNVSAIHIKHASTKFRPIWALRIFYEENVLLYRRYIAPTKDILSNSVTILALRIRKHLHILYIYLSNPKA